MLHSNRAINGLLTLIYSLLALLALKLFFHYLFFPLLPLGVAWLLSCLIIRPVDYLSKKKLLPRSAASVLMTLVIVAAVAAAAAALVAFLTVQTQRLMTYLPAILNDLERQLDVLQQRLDHWCSRLPGWDGDRTLLSLKHWLSQIEPPELSFSGVVSSIGWAASSLPTILLTVIFLLASTIFLTSRRAEIVAFVRRQLPARLQEACQKLRRFLASSCLCWLKAQGILVCVTFGLLLGGFFLLRQPSPLTLAFLVALVDALPVLGVGTILLPWAVIDLLSGGYSHGIGLLALYAVVLAVRNALEPHIVGRQLGLHPFVTLLCLYLGWRLAGLWGMLLAPVLVLSLVKLREWEYIKLWR